MLLFSFDSFPERLWTLQICTQFYVLHLLQKTNLKINNRTISLLYTLFPTPFRLSSL